MNILVLEDNGSVSVTLGRALNTEGHQILAANGINDANHHWSQRTTVPIHAMIIDLNMRCDGLTDLQQKDSRDGLLTGWIWLRDTVLAHVPDIRNRVMFYSDYLSDLERYVPAPEYAGIRRFAKSDSSSARDLLRYLHSMSPHVAPQLEARNDSQIHKLP
jgi:hypothetical protein